MPARSGRAVPHVALLRGINVGGRHMLPMAELVPMFVEAGCTEVRTYIQSGNVAFGATRACAERLARRLPGSIEDHFGFRPLVMVRTGEEMERVAAGNPFLAVDPRGAALYVGFLAEAPDARSIAGVDLRRSPGDSMLVRGREVYLHLARGVLKTKLTGPYLDSALGTMSTLRNWRTVLRLAGMVREAG